MFSTNDRDTLEMFRDLVLSSATHTHNIKHNNSEIQQYQVEHWARCVVHVDWSVSVAASVCNDDSAVITSKTNRLKSSTGFPFLIVLFRSVEIFYKHLSTRMKEFGFVRRVIFSELRAMMWSDRVLLVSRYVCEPSVSVKRKTSKSRCKSVKELTQTFACFSWMLISWYYNSVASCYEHIIWGTCFWIYWTRSINVELN